MRRLIFKGYSIETFEEDNVATRRLLVEDEENLISKPSLLLCFEMIIAPVVHLLHEPDIFFIPDRSLYKVPFAALHDESGTFLSETFRIHIMPSLAALKLIQDSPADYHSQSGALRWLILRLVGYITRDTLGSYHHGFARKKKQKRSGNWLMLSLC